MVQTPTDGRTWKVFFETTQSETGWTVNCLNSLGHAALTTFWHRVEALYPDTWEWQVGVVRLDLPWCFACPLCCYSRIATFSILFDLHDACGCFGLLAYGSHDACDKLSKQASPRLWCISSSLGPSKWSSHVNVYTGCLDCFLSIFYFQLVRSVSLSDLCPVLLCLVDGYWCMCLSPQCCSVLAKEEMALLEHEDDIETWAAVISTHTEACFFGHPSNFGCSNSNGSEYFSGSAWCMANFNMRSIWSHLKALSIKHQETFQAKCARFPAIGDPTRQHLRANAIHVKDTDTDAKPLLFFLFIAKDWLEDSTFQPSMYSCQGASTSPLLGWPISNCSHYQLRRRRWEQWSIATWTGRCWRLQCKGLLHTFVELNCRFLRL